MTEEDIENMTVVEYETFLKEQYDALKVIVTETYKAQLREAVDARKAWVARGKQKRT